MDEALRRQLLAEEHLRLLRIGYLVSASMTALFGLFGFFYVFMGLMVTRIPDQAGQAFPRGIGLFFGFFGLIFVGVGLTLAGLKFYAAHCLKHRQSRTICICIAAVTCLGVPYGTLLGVLTIMALSRPETTTLFER